MGLYRWCGKQLPNQIYKLPIQGYSDEKSSMKNLQFILLVVVFTSIISNTASAQWAYDDFSSYDQIQMEIERQNRMMIEQSQRIMQELQARQNRAHQLAIQEYRQQYNDYQTSDAQVLEILWQQFLRENPNYIQNQQQLHNQRMADIQSGHTVERLRELGFEASGSDMCGHVDFVKKLHSVLIDIGIGQPLSQPRQFVFGASRYSKPLNPI